MQLKRWTKEVPLCATAALLACGAAMAQMQGGSAGQMPGQQSPMPGQSTVPFTPGGNIPGAQNNAEPSFEDQSFLRKTLEDDVAEEQMGQLAAQKSQSKDVKQFGLKMAQIHKELTNQIKPVAEKLEVSEPKQPSKKDRQEVAKMQTLSGADFDAAFIQAMLKDQRSDLKEFKSEANSAQTPAVQQLAKMDVPVLSQHLQVLEKLAQVHDVPVESKK